MMTGDYFAPIRVGTGTGDAVALGMGKKDKTSLLSPLILLRASMVLLDLYPYSYTTFVLCIMISW